MKFHAIARTHLGVSALALALLACHHHHGGSNTPASLACNPAWQPTFPGQAGATASVRALAVFDDGAGPALCAGGGFVTAGGLSVNGIARWNGSAWSALGSGVTNGAVHTLLGFDDGSGPALYAGGDFEMMDGQFALGLAKWDGTSWIPLGSATGFDFRTLAAFGDSGGPALYAGGYFPGLGTHIRKSQSAAWTTPDGGTDGEVDALVVFDDGSGEALYVGGYFTLAGGIAATNIARWDGETWRALGSGIGGQVDALCTFDDGSGPALYAAGSFTSAGGVSANRIAKWNGSAWSALGSGLGGGGSTRVAALTVFDDGSGRALYVAGTFASAGGVAAAGIAKYDASGWSALGSGLNGPGYAIAAFGSGESSALYVGGSFSAAGGQSASSIAQWANPQGCGEPGVPICEPLVGGVMDCPCGNTPSVRGVGCDNSSGAGGARLTATGIARLSYDTVTLIADNAVSATPSIVLQGSDVLPTGIVFGQGVRCLSGSLKRMYVKTAVAGSVTAPEASDPRLSVRSAALGQAIAAGTHSYYGVYYRDPIVLGSCPGWAMFNITQQLDILWSP